MLRPRASSRAPRSGRLMTDDEIVDVLRTSAIVIGGRALITDSPTERGLLLELEARCIDAAFALADRIAHRL